MDTTENSKKETLHFRIGLFIGLAGLIVGIAGLDFTKLHFSKNNANREIGTTATNSFATLKINSQIADSGVKKNLVVKNEIKKKKSKSQSHNIKKKYRKNNRLAKNTHNHFSRGSIPQTKNNPNWVNGHYIPKPSDEGTWYYTKAYRANGDYDYVLCPPSSAAFRMSGPKNCDPIAVLKSIRDREREGK